MIVIVVCQESLIRQLILAGEFVEELDVPVIKVIVIGMDIIGWWYLNQLKVWKG